MFLACLSVGIVGISSAPTKKAEATTISGDANFQTVETFRMEGAQVRVSGDPGLRFIASISKEEYDALVAAYDSVEMGMLVIPKDNLTGELTLENTTDSIKKVYRQGASLVDSGDNYEFRAVLYNIPSASYGRDILGRAYMTVDDGTDTKTFYADMMTRNIAYVSYMVTEVLTSSPFYGRSNATLDGYIGDKTFHQITVPTGASCDYLYAYEGQEVEITVENDAASMTITGAEASSKTDNVYTVTMGDSAISASSLSATVDLGTFDTLVSDKTFDIGSLVGTVSTITSNFTYNAATGVLSTTNGAGEYAVTITTDAGYTYNLTACVITATISSYSEFCSVRDANTTDGTWSGYYILTNNIDIPSADAYSSSVSTFSGTFDGRGHTMFNGKFHGAQTDSKYSLFGNVSGTLKNTAFVNPVIGILSGIVYQVTATGVVDNCLFDALRLGNTVYSNQSPIYDVAPGGTISNSIFYFASGDGSGNDKGAFTMLRGTTSNVYVFSTKMTGWDNRESKTGATLYSYSTTLSSAGLSSSSVGFKSYFDLTGTKAAFNAIDFDVTVDLFLNKADGNKTVSLTGDLGVANGTVSYVKIDGETVEFVQRGANVTINTPTGEHTVAIKVGNKEYLFNAVAVTERIDNASELAAFASRSNEGYYVLGGNIDASALTLMNTDAAFTGTFDGRGYVISGGSFSSANGNKPGGLFGTVDTGSLVKNLAITNATLTTEADYNWVYTSVLTGRGNFCGTLEQCYVEITAKGSSTHCAGVVGNLSDGTIRNVILKSVSGLERNVCDMVLGTSSISNTYVIGGVASNCGWNQNSSPVSISNVASLSSGQQATFDSDIWLFLDGAPNFIRGLDFSQASDTGVTLYVDSTDNTVTLSQLGLDGTLQAVFDSASNQAGENMTSSQVDMTGGTLGEAETYYALVSGNLYGFDVFTVTEMIDDASELSAFASRSNEGYYILTGNIDASALTLMNTDATFTGTFDGRGYVISGGTFSSANGNKPGGLFGTIDTGSLVKNLAITDATLTTEGDYNWVYTSILAGGGRLKGTLEQCYIEITSKGSTTHAMGIACHTEGATIRNVILKSVSGLEKNVCDMVLGSSSISNTYVIGGVATNVGWNQNGSPVSISSVASLTSGQQASFDGDIWEFVDGMPYFKSMLADVGSATPILAAAPTVYADAGDGTQEVRFSSLGLSSDTVNAVYNAGGLPISYTQSASGFSPAGLQGGEQTVYADVGGTLYSFRLLCITAKIDNASELAAFSPAGNSGYYILGADIDASSTNLSASNVTTDGLGFKGTFDGRGHTIDGAFVTNGGLFGGISTGGVVKNLAFTNTEYGYSGIGSAFGANNYGTIDNCYIKIVDQGKSGRGGAQQTYCALSAFANLNYGTISNCVSDMPEWGTGEHKAICQFNYATISNVYCAGNETATYYNLESSWSVSNVASIGFYGAYNLPYWNLPSESTTGFSSTYWNFTSFHLPLFKSLQECDLTASGAADYSIIRGSDVISVAAATALQTYFNAATGVTLDIYDISEYASALAAHSHYISIGSTYQLHNTGLWSAIGSGISGNDEYGLGTSGYVIDTINGNVYITGFYKGNNLHGTLNGVYGWLSEQFGLEMFADDEYYIDTGCSDEALENINFKRVPAINAVVGGNSDSSGVASMGFYSLNGSCLTTSSGLVAGSFGRGQVKPFHNFLDYLPQTTNTSSVEGNPNGVEVATNYGSGHTAPNNNFTDGYWYYFDNVYDNRNVYDLCLAQNQSDIISALLDRMATVIAWSGAAHYNYIAFSHEDGPYWCPHCRQKYANTAALQSQYSSESKYITAIYTEFMIKLASAMASDGRFNGRTLVMSCYGLASDMPVSGTAGNYSIDGGISSYMTSNSLSLPSNLAVCMSYSLLNNYSGAVDTSAHADRVEKWNTITDRIMFWTYIENYENYFAPFDGLNQIQASMQFAANSGCEWYFPQGMNDIGSTSTDWGALENYVISKLRWDVNADVDTLISNFFDQYYGAASTAMKSLYSSYKTKMASLFSSYGFGGTYNKLDNGSGVNYISTTCWSRAEIESFLSQISTARSALLTAKNGGSITAARYNELISRVNVEELIYKYLYIKLYSSYAVSYYGAENLAALKTAFVSECSDLGVTNIAEGVALTTSYL